MIVPPVKTAPDPVVDRLGKLLAKELLCCTLHYFASRNSGSLGVNISKCQILKIGFSKFAIFQITRPDVHFEVPKKRKVATKTIPYERYGEILFQKVALCYLLHFVQDGSSKNALEN